MKKTNLLNDLLTTNRFNPEALLKELDQISDKMDTLIEQTSTLMESDETSSDLTNVIADLEMVSKQMDAAKRALGIVNTMEPGEYRANHASRVMGNMNRIRAAVRRAERALADATQVA